MKDFVASFSSEIKSENESTYRSDLCNPIVRTKI